MATKLPKAGDSISVDKFHVSECNVRYGEPFGETEQDQILIDQVRHGKIVQPFKARLEGNGFGVYVGRRRFEAKKRVGVKAFVVGSDVIITDVNEDEAREESLIENLNILRASMNPITRAKKLRDMIARSPTGLRGTARKLGAPPSNLSEWLSMLQLSPKMQDCVAKGLLQYTDALKLARLKLGEAMQDKLAEVLKTDGLDAYKSELVRVSVGKIKRGIPKGVYIILRTTFDKRYKPDVELYERLSELAKSKKMQVDEYVKDILREHLKLIA